MTSNDLSGNWKIDKRVPLVVIISIVGYLGYAVYEASAYNARMVAAETALSVHGSEIAKLNDSREDFDKRLIRLEDKMDLVLDFMAKIEERTRPAPLPTP